MNEVKSRLSDRQLYALEHPVRSYQEAMFPVYRETVFLDNDRYITIVTVERHSNKNGGAPIWFSRVAYISSLAVKNEMIPYEKASAAVQRKLNRMAFQLLLNVGKGSPQQAESTIAVAFWKPLTADEENELVTAYRQDAQCVID